MREMKKWQSQVAQVQNIYTQCPTDNRMLDIGTEAKVVSVSIESNKRTYTCVLTWNFWHSSSINMWMFRTHWKNGRLGINGYPVSSSATWWHRHGIFGAAQARAHWMIEKCPCFHQLLTPFFPSIFWFPNNIFDKSTPVPDEVVAGL